METFSLLKYWRGSGTTSAANVRTAAVNVGTTTTTIATSVLRSSMTETSSEGEDEGSFFDLELSASHINEEQTVVENCDSSSESENEGEDGENSSNNLVFKGQFVPLDVDEPSSIVIASSSDNNKPPHFSVSLLKSATKFRIFILGLKKPKPSQSTSHQNPNAAAGIAASPNHNKFFVKFNVEEVPIVSLFARETRSKKNTKTQKVTQNQEEQEEKLNASSKETVQKYISKIKPLYVRVSKRYGEKLRFSGLLSAEDGAAVRIPLAGTKIVRQRLGKSKSAVVAAVASPPSVNQWRDDSLQQQQDGIQSAIAHCKMTLNAAKGIQSPLLRSKSDPSDDRSDKLNAEL